MMGGGLHWVTLHSQGQRIEKFGRYSHTHIGDVIHIMHVKTY